MKLSKDCEIFEICAWGFAVIAKVVSLQMYAAWRQPFIIGATAHFFLIGIHISLENCGDVTSLCSFQSISGPSLSSYSEDGNHSE